MRKNCILLLLMLILPVSVSLGDTPKPVTKGTFVDCTGTRHPWYINQAHTLFWDGKPWIPVGGMYCPPYIWENNDSGWALTAAQLDLLKEKGVLDLYVHFAGPQFVSAESLQRIFDALDQRGFRYGMEITMSPEPGPAWCVGEGPEVEAKAEARFDTGSPCEVIAKAECKGALRALFAATDAGGALIASGKAKVEGDSVSAAVTLKPGEKAKVRFVVERKSDPFFWDGHYEAYEKKITEFYSGIRFGPGFRFVVDPFGNEMQINHAQLPSTPDYAARFSVWLEKRYGTPGKLAQAWKIAPLSFKQAAALVPVMPVLVNPETGKAVKVDLTGSQCWEDFIEFNGREARGYCNRIADALKRVADVPVVFKHAGPIARHRVNNAGGTGGFDGIGMEPYGTGETAAMMNAAVCYSEAEEASKTTWLLVTETSEAAFEHQLENIGYLDRMSMYQGLSSLLSSGAKGIFLFGLAFGPNPGQFWMSEFLRDPRQLGWAAGFRKILESAPKLTDYRPNAYYRFPALETDRQAFHGPERDFAGIDGNWNGRNIERARDRTWILPAFDADVETPLLIANLERAPASVRWGAELVKRIAARKRTVYIGFRYDLGAIPELDRYFTDHFSTDSDGAKIQALRIVPDAEVLARGSDGSVWNMKVGSLQIISREVPDAQGWQPVGLALPKDTGSPTLTDFMEKVLDCKVLDSRSARVVSFNDNGVPTSYLWSLDKEGFRIPIGGIKPPAKIEYPDGSPVPVADGKILLPLEETPAVVETPVAFVRGKHAEIGKSPDSVVFRSLGVFPPIESEDPNTAEFEAEAPTESNWTLGRFGGLTRLSGSAMWALDTTAPLPKYGSYFTRYEFQWKRNEKMQLWVREQTGGSPCRWRLNLGPWQEVPADVEDVNKQFVAPWAPFDDDKLHFAWHHYGAAELTTDDNLLEIEVLSKRAKGDKYSKFLDKIVFAPEGWKPE